VSRAEDRPRYGPADSLKSPRFTGIRTFARCPHVEQLDGVDVATVGIPFDTGTSFRAGARFGPSAIREASLLLRPWHPQLAVDVFGSQSFVDYGDLDITPGNAERTAAQIATGLRPFAELGVTPIVLGGDHSVVLGELRAQAAVHGPLGLVLLDAHADTWEAYYGERFFHGTPFRRALEEGLLAPERSLLAGMRGPLYAAGDLDETREMGFDVITCDELRAMSPAEYSTRVRGHVGEGPAFFSFDIDVLDPAFAPGTGTPELAGLLPHEAMPLIRSLAGIDFCGFDVVEVSPSYDNAGLTTALNAAGIVYEFLAISALGRRG
jgi:agmatinase